MTKTNQTAVARYKELERVNKIEDFMAKLKAQDNLVESWFYEDEKRPGLVEGKEVRFSVADGYAHYLIYSFTKTKVKLLWLDICDGYAVNTFGVDSNGFVIAPRQVIEREVNFREGMAKLFGK
jgi:hypothetical protein